MKWRVWICLLSLSVLWGGSFFFAKVALGTLGPFTVVFCRVALAALALNLARPLRRDAPWRTYFAMGALNNVVPFALSWLAVSDVASFDNINAVASAAACMAVRTELARL